MCSLNFSLPRDGAYLPILELELVGNYQCRINLNNTIILRSYTMCILYLSDICWRGVYISSTLILSLFPLKGKGRDGILFTLELRSSITQFLVCYGGTRPPLEEGSLLFPLPPPSVYRRITVFAIQEDEQ